MIFAASNKRNTYSLLNETYYWIERHEDDPPLRLVRGILKRQFDDYPDRFPNMQSLSDACLKIIRENPLQFKENSDESAAREIFLTRTWTNPKVAIEAFRDLWRGYSDVQIIENQNGLEQDKEKYLKFLRQMIIKNEKRINQFRRRRREITVDRLKTNLRNLRSVGQEIGQAYQRPMLASLQKLKYGAFLRRRFSYPSSYYLPNDYFLFKRRIMARDPDKLLFPLRFLQRIPAKMYDSLEYKWLKGIGREELILSFDDPKSDDRTFFHELGEQLSGISKQLNINRELQIEEMEKSYETKCYTAVTLLAMTQIEGIIWAFANHLNKKGIKVFRRTKGSKQKYYPFEWDHEHRRYKNLEGNSPVANMQMQLTSARKLLMKTRIGSLIDEGLFGYLIDEFYDDRNNLTHGAFEGRNLQVDAICSLLCYDMCLLAISGHLKMKRLRAIHKLHREAET